MATTSGEQKVARMCRGTTERRGVRFNSFHPDLALQLTFVVPPPLEWEINLFVASPRVRVGVIDAEIHFGCCERVQSLLVSIPLQR